MKGRRHWKFTALVLVLTAMVLVTAVVAHGQEVSPREGPSAVTTPAIRNVIIIGFVGGFVSRDDTRHPEVQFAAYLRDRYPFAHVEVFGNHHGRKALQQVVRLLDTDHDGAISSAERERSTIIIYGHSWGATETAEFASQLGQMDIPVALTIQIDTIAKPGHRASPISPNVASAINFYQTEGPLHGPVLFPHISVRTDDAPRKTVYCITHTGMANARVPPLAPSRNGSPGPSRPPRRWPGLFIAALLQGWNCGPRRSWPLAPSNRDEVSLRHERLKWPPTCHFLT